MTRPLLVALIAALGCASPVATRLEDPERARAVRRIAILPFTQDPAGALPIPDGAEDVVGARVLEALHGHFALIPPEESRHVLESLGRAGARDIAAKLGVDAVLAGKLMRYIERSGGPSGTSQPASVAFELELRAADGSVLWVGNYDETQRALSEDLGTLPRAAKRGFRWVTADELVAYGAQTLVAELLAGVG